MCATEIRALALAFVFGVGLPRGKVLNIAVGCRSADSVGPGCSGIAGVCGEPISVSPPAPSHQ